MSSISLDLEPGTEVKTKHGTGVIVAYEVIANTVKRYVVHLDKSPFSHNPVFYWPSQCSMIVER